jgi:hypothetical protein
VSKINKLIMQRENFLDFRVFRGALKPELSDLQVNLKAYFTKAAFGRDAEHLNKLIERTASDQISINLNFSHGTLVRPLLEALLKLKPEPKLEAELLKTEEYIPLVELTKAFKEGRLKSELIDHPGDKLELSISLNKTLNDRITNQLNLLFSLGLHKLSENATENSRIDIAFNSSFTKGAKNTLGQVSEQFEARISIGDQTLRDAVIEHLGRFDDFLLHNPLWLLLKTSKKLKLDLELEEAQALLPDVKQLVEEVLYAQYSHLVSLQKGEESLGDLWGAIALVDFAVIVPDRLYFAGNIRKNF